MHRPTTLWQLFHLLDNTTGIHFSACQVFLEASIEIYAVYKDRKAEIYRLEHMDPCVATDAFVYPFNESNSI
jgi:hypothetical protein